MLIPIKQQSSRTRQQKHISKFLKKLAERISIKNQRSQAQRKQSESLTRSLRQQKPPFCDSSRDVQALSPAARQNGPTEFISPKAFFQDIKDLASMGEEPFEGGTFMVKIGDELKQATTQAEAFRLQSEMLFHDAGELNKKMEDQGHVFDLVRKAMEGVVAIDIRDYFETSTKAAEDALKKLGLI